MICQLLQCDLKTPHLPSRTADYCSKGIQFVILRLHDENTERVIEFRLFSSCHLYFDWPTTSAVVLVLYSGEVLRDINASLIHVI
jgi:hypothetical protein